MRDPSETLADDGTIRTGVDRAKIPARFAGVLDAAVSSIGSVCPEASVYVYGSVATGVARSPQSDVDLLTIALPAEPAAEIGEHLSTRFGEICRGVEIAASAASDFDGDRDDAYGGRVFLHHYCVHLSGPDLDRANTAFPGDHRAARGFNGDIAQHAARWQRAICDTEPAQLGRRVARKSLLAVAGLVSVHDSTWTTDRELAAWRWQQVHPELTDGLDELLAWSDNREMATPDRLAHQLATTVDRIIGQFTADIGLWST